MSRNARSHASGSRMSCTSKVGLRAAVWHWAVPSERSSMTKTSSPRDSKELTTDEPMNPHPPVTRYLPMSPFFPAGGCRSPSCSQYLGDDLQKALRDQVDGAPLRVVARRRGTQLDGNGWVGQ